jgi:hypothetical protein
MVLCTEGYGVIGSSKLQITNNKQFPNSNYPNNYEPGTSLRPHRESEVSYLIVGDKNVRVPTKGGPNDLIPNNKIGLIPFFVFVSDLNIGI